MRLNLNLSKEDAYCLKVVATAGKTTLDDNENN